MENVAESSVVLCCSTCRRALVTLADVIDHKPDCNSRFRSIGIEVRSNLGSKLHPKCNVYHIPPQNWIEEAFETNEGSTQMEGKIYCLGTEKKKCKAVLGKWSWSGMPCSCGEWKSPCFMLHCKSVDYFTRNAV